MRLTRKTKTRRFFFNLKQSDGFSHENLDSVLMVREGKWVGWN